MNLRNLSFKNGFEKIAKKHEKRLSGPTGGAAGGAIGGGLSMAVIGKSKKERMLLVPIGILGGGIGGYLGIKQHNKQLHKKTAAPAWYYEMNKTMNPLKSMKNYSTAGLKKTKIGKGLGKP